MADLFEPVKPGDLITAELMNSLLTTVGGLDERVAALETATKGSISGTVKDIESGQPIVGAIVKAIMGNVTYNSTPTDSQGIYTVADLIPGEYTVIATAENYLQSPAQTVSIAPGIPRTANFLLSRTAGLVVVPNLFALTLAEARTVVSLPTVNMEIGTVITSDGEVFTADNSTIQARVILNQVPDPNLAVSADTKINVVVSGAAEGGIGTGDVIILDFIPPKSEGRAIGEDLTIIGRNFEIPVQNNIVTIGGVQVLPPASGESPFLTGSGSERLIFIIPDIPGIPDGGKEVDVIVSNKNGEARDKYLVKPQTTAVPPEITEVLGTGPVGDAIDKPNAVRIGAPFIIRGSNFAQNAQENEIRFTAGTLVVDVPSENINVGSSSPTEILVDSFPDFTPAPPSGGQPMILSIRVAGLLATHATQVLVFPSSG